MCVVLELDTISDLYEQSNGGVLIDEVVETMKISVKAFNVPSYDC